MCSSRSIVHLEKKRCGPPPQQHNTKNISVGIIGKQLMHTVLLRFGEAANEHIAYVYIFTIKYTSKIIHKP